MLTIGASGVEGERKARAAAWALRAAVPRWAALVGWLCGEGRPSWCARAGGKLGRAGCRPARQRGAAAEWAAPGKAGREGGGRRPGWLELGQKVNFFFFPNQIFIQFYFLHFHF